jgi:peptidoglycan/xylan/chitin deacetylase (PgdA/CDA1 family)
VRPRDVVPEPLRERGRLRRAQALARGARDSSAPVGAALVLHGVEPAAGDPATEIEPPVSTAWLDGLVAGLAGSYRLVHAAELVGAAGARRAGEPVPVALTFDDDLRSHVEHAAPVLARRGATATAFVGGVSRPPWWEMLQAALDRGELRPDDLAGVDQTLVRAALAREPRAARRLAAAVEGLPPGERDAIAASLDRFGDDVQPPLGADGIRGLVAAGWEIGFHTVRHDVLTALGDDALHAALVDGRAELEELTGGPIRTIAYPHGKAGAREAAAAQAAGFETGFTGAAEIVTAATPPLLVGRLQPDRFSSGRALLQLALALQVEV